MNIGDSDLPAHAPHRHQYHWISGLCEICDRPQPEWLTADETATTADGPSGFAVWRAWWAGLPSMVRWFLVGVIASVAIGMLTKPLDGVIPPTGDMQSVIDGIDNAGG